MTAPVEWLDRAKRIQPRLTVEVERIVPATFGLFGVTFRAACPSCGAIAGLDADAARLYDPSWDEAERSAALSEAGTMIARAIAEPHDTPDRNGDRCDGERIL